VTHPATITRVLGVGPETEGLPVRPLRTVAFRGHCGECGWLGRKRGNYLTARYDVAQHKARAR
jgi:hypothetical protein